MAFLQDLLQLAFGAALFAAAGVLMARALFKGRVVSLAATAAYGLGLSLVVPPLFLLALNLLVGVPLNSLPAVYGAYAACGAAALFRLRFKA